MQALTVSRPDLNMQVTLYRAETVMPLILRYFRLTPDFSEVVESVGEFLKDAGNNYGCQYVALVPVEPDGMAYLPVHCKRVISVSKAPSGISEANSSLWEPGRYLYGGRQWVADQITGMTCWRSDLLEDLASWPGQVAEPYQRTPEGLFMRQYRRPLASFTPCVVVVYDAKLTDERGYPLVGEHDGPGAAHYWNWQRLQADAYGGIQSAIALLPMATDSMNRTMGQAKIGEGISAAGWEHILRVSASWDRASFHYGFQTPVPGQLPGRHDYQGSYGLAN